MDDDSESFCCLGPAVTVKVTVTRNPCRSGQWQPLARLPGL